MSYFSQGTIFQYFQMAITKGRVNQGSNLCCCDYIFVFVSEIDIIKSHSYYWVEWINYKLFFHLRNSNRIAHKMRVLHKTLRSSFNVELIKITRKIISVEKSVASCLKWIRKEQRVTRDAISGNLATKSVKCNKERFKCWIEITPTNKTKRRGINKRITGNRPKWA